MEEEWFGKKHRGGSPLQPPPFFHLAGTELVEADEFDGFGLHQRALRVHHEVHEGVHAVQLVVRDVAHCLFSHRALVRVTRALVVVGVGDQPRHHAQDGERLNLHVRHLPTQGVGVGQR